MSQEEKKFEYAGGEFENDAPYDEAIHGLGANAVPFQADVGSEDNGSVAGGDMNALLADLMGSGEYDDNADTCFSINAAASFAALISPEEQLAEVTWKKLDVEHLLAVTDSATPLEIMQLVLLLRLFRQQSAAATSTSAAPASSTRFASFTPSQHSAVVQKWFEDQQKTLMQYLSLLGMALNQQGQSYSILFHGSIANASTIAEIDSDILQLLSLTDVINIEVAVSQLVTECMKFLADLSSSSSSSSLSSTSFQLNERSKQLLKLPVELGAEDEINDIQLRIPTSASADSTSSAPAAPKHLSFAYPSSLLYASSRDDTVHKFLSLFPDIFQAILSALKKDQGCPDKETEGLFHRYLKSIPHSSALATLLSMDNPAVEEPGTFFTNFIPAALEVIQAPSAPPASSSSSSQ